MLHSILFISPAQCDHLPRFTKELYNQTVCNPSGTNKTQDILTLSCAIEVLSKSSKTHYIRWIQALDVNDNNWIINNETYNITERRMSNQIVICFYYRVNTNS